MYNQPKSKARSSHGRASTNKLGSIVRSQPQTSKFSSQIKPLSFTNEDNNPISPNSPSEGTNMKKKLMHILGRSNAITNTKGEIQIGNKVYQISPKAKGQVKLFKSGYCISVGNLVVQPQKNAVKSQILQVSKSNIQKPHNLTAEDKINRGKSPKCSNSLGEKKGKASIHQKQNLFSLIKTINNFMSKSRQQQREEMKQYNEYMNHKNLIRSYDKLTDQSSWPKQERTSTTKNEDNSQTNLYGPSERGSLLKTFKRISDLKKQDNDNIYKKKRPNELEELPIDQQHFKFLSHKNSKSMVEIINQRKRTLSQSPQHLQSSKEKLYEVYKRVQVILNQHKEREVCLQNQMKVLRKQVLHWKHKYIERTQELHFLKNLQ